jgi:hypothetical protein
LDAAAEKKYGPLRGFQQGFEGTELGWGRE